MDSSKTNGRSDGSLGRERRGTGVGDRHELLVDELFEPCSGELAAISVVLDSSEGKLCSGKKGLVDEAMRRPRSCLPEHAACILRLRLFARTYFGLLTRDVS
jgi:hypothetical protein